MFKRLGISVALVLTFGMSAMASIPASEANAASPASPVLEKGDHDGYVWGLQNRLLQLGLYKGEVDGLFGPLTRQAVINYQQKNNNLSVDGEVGSETWSALRNQTLTTDQIQKLAQLVYAEARGESLKGQVAVAGVTLNRIDSNKFPDTVSGVIHESLAYEPVQNGSFYNQPSEEPYQAVYLAIQGWDPSQGSLYFFNPSKVDADNWIWTRTQTVQIGNHSFAK